MKIISKFEALGISKAQEWLSWHLNCCTMPDVWKFHLISFDWIHIIYMGWVFAIEVLPRLVKHRWRVIVLTEVYSSVGSYLISVYVLHESLQMNYWKVNWIAKWLLISAHCLELEYNYLMMGITRRMTQFLVLVHHSEFWETAMHNASENGPVSIISWVEGDIDSGPVVEISSSKGIKRSSLSYLSPEDGNTSCFRNIIYSRFIELRTMPKSRKPVILTITYALNSPGIQFVDL